VSFIVGFKYVSYSYISFSFSELNVIFKKWKNHLDGNYGGTSNNHELTIKKFQRTFLRVISKYVNYQDILRLKSKSLTLRRGRNIKEYEKIKIFAKTYRKNQSR